MIQQSDALSIARFRLLGEKDNMCRPICLREKKTEWEINTKHGIFGVRGMELEKGKGRDNEIDKYKYIVSGREICHMYISKYRETDRDAHIHKYNTHIH